MDVVQYPGPVLRRGGKKVESFGPELTRLAEQMLETMYSSKGVGLAAPQVGFELDLLVFNPSGDPADKSGERVLVNPELLERKGKEFGEEGCLSFPGLYADVERAVTVAVRFQDLQGAVHEERLTDFDARIVQHEIDHLRGVLFVDRLSSVEKLRVRTHLKEMEERVPASSRGQARA